MEALALDSNFLQDRCETHMQSDHGGLRFSMELLTPASFQLALEQQHNRSAAASQGRYQFQFRLYADNIKTVDAYKLTKIICKQVRPIS